MITQINAQEVIKKDFINIFEISLLFDVSGITARRYINGIFKEIDSLKEQLKLIDQNDQGVINQKIEVLSGKVRRRVVGKTKANGDIFILELAKKEALESWSLRPDIKDVFQQEINQVKEPTQPKQNISVDQNEQVEKNQQANNQPLAPEPDQPQVSLPKVERYEQPNLVTDIYGQKYVTLLETQLVEKDNTIKDLRETNKFLSITNSKLNEQLKFLLEKPQNQNPPPQNAG
jgi:hypothetical protein